MEVDYTIIGAGYAGLSAAALLSHFGFSVVVLESHTYVGGCASYFDRKEFTFDVGATTLSGLLPHQPLGKIFSTLGITPNVKKLDPGMVIFLDDKKITRYAEQQQWIEEASSQFQPKGQQQFWDTLFTMEAELWKMLEHLVYFPPTSPSDLLTLFPLLKPSILGSATGLIRPLYTLLEKHRLHIDKQFVRFVDEQLLISTQNKSDLAPLLPSSIGLVYPSETYYPLGGMSKPVELLADSFKANKGTILFKQRVTSIEQLPSKQYKLSTAKGKEIVSKGIISSIPIWNLPAITSGYIQKYFEKKSRQHPNGWGAFTINFAIEDTMDLETAYYQIHSRSPIPHCSSDSMFVSFSLRDDLEKSPEGWYTVTISTHTKAEDWFELSEEEYERRKEQVTKHLLQEFDHRFDGFTGATKQYVLSGTPRTFEFYTKRYNGYVGGIPHTIEKPLPFMTPNKTPFDNFYVIGDTTFPGQGTPAVALGAWNVVQRIIR
jgi:C-3',4' desaturase CrtD